MEFEQAKEIINKSKSIYIVAHVNPDGDAIGSTYGMYFAMKKLNKDVHVIMPEYSDVFKFLPDITKICEKDIYVENYDLLIALDASDKTRLALSDEAFSRAKNVIMFDHHQVSHPYGDVRYINDNMSSASEVVYNFLKYLGIKFDPEMATYIYTGIMTDTGSFNYSNTSSDTHIAAAELIKAGADHVTVCKKLNDTIKEAKLKLIAKTIENMEVYNEGKVRYSLVDYDTINSLGLDEEDAEGMTNYLRMVEGTEVGIYIRGNKNGTYKVSMRSIGNVDISKIAIANGGGGHPRAAGFTIYEDLDGIKNKVLKAVEVMLVDGATN